MTNTSGSPLPSLFGHAQRRALKARTLTRPEWRALAREVRHLSRNGYTRGQRRAAEVGRELATLTGCEVGRFTPEKVDMLAARFWLLAGGTDCTRTDPRDCNGIKGALRARLALSWYPLVPNRLAQASEIGLSLAGLQ